MILQTHPSGEGILQTAMYSDEPLPRTAKNATSKPTTSFECKIAEWPMAWMWMTGSKPKQKLSTPTAPRRPRKCARRDAFRNAEKVPPTASSLKRILSRRSRQKGRRGVINTFFAGACKAEWNHPSAVHSYKKTSFRLRILYVCFCADVHPTGRNAQKRPRDSNSMACISELRSL